MHDKTLEPYRHRHDFADDQVTEGERRTWIVIVLTALTMVIEIAAGVVFGSMALLADGVHMASHAAALGIAAFAYVYARRRAGDARFSFGTGKVNALAGFASAILLAGFAVLMAFESLKRLADPVPIVFDAAIGVAVLGLIVNAVSAVILGHGHSHTPGHAHGPGHGHDHHHPGHDHPTPHHGHTHDPEDSVDHNLRGAYLHVLADAVTSLTAIIALLAGKYMGWGFMDPVMGLVGSALIARWSWGLLQQTASVLLDRQAPEMLQASIRESIESDADNRVADLHVWSIGPGMRAAIVSLVTRHPRPPAHYKALLPVPLHHITVEVQPCTTDPGAPRLDVSTREKSTPEKSRDTRVGQEASFGNPRPPLRDLVAPHDG